ncbi:MAG TPA: methyltransferase domain-containing protein, partial [Polyangiaceae bacterium]
SLPFPDQTFDVVLCQLGLPFFGDRVKALWEMRRVLRAGGHSVSVVWNEIGTAPAFDRLAPIVERIAGQRAVIAFRAPFALGQRDALLELLASSGAGQSKVATEQSRASFLSVRSFVEAELRGWLPIMGVELQEDQMRGVLAEAEESLRDLVGPDGRLEFEMSAHIVTMPGGS